MAEITLPHDGRNRQSSLKQTHTLSLPSISQKRPTDALDGPRTLIPAIISSYEKRNSSDYRYYGHQYLLLVIFSYFDIYDIHCCIVLLLPPSPCYVIFLLFLSCLFVSHYFPLFLLLNLYPFLPFTHSIRYGTCSFPLAIPSPVLHFSLPSYSPYFPSLLSLKCSFPGFPL